MTVRTSTAAARFAALLLAGVLATSCTGGAPEEEADAERAELDRAAGALAVTVLRPGAERAFARGGHPVEGGLACTSGARPSASEEPGEPEQTEETEETVGRTARAEDNGESEAPGGHMRVHCTGRTGEGEEVLFEGLLLRDALARREDGDDSLRGTYTGRVGGEEVFTMDCFQCAPADAEESGDPAEDEAAERDSEDDAD